MNLSTHNNAESRPGHEARTRHLSPEGLEAVRVRYGIRTTAYLDMYQSVAMKWPELVQSQQPNAAAVAQHLVANSKIIEEKFVERPAIEAQDVVDDPLTQAQDAVRKEYERVLAEQQEQAHA